MTEINWKDNLRIAWFGNFLTGASISLVVPFMPIFVENLGVGSDQAAFYAGLVPFLQHFSLLSGASLLTNTVESP